MPKEKVPAKIEDIDRNPCVYFIFSPDHGRVKIGFSEKKLSLRLDAIRSMNAGEVVPLGFMKGSRELESRLHDRFDSKNHHGEWFNWDDELAEFVRDHALPWPHEDKNCWTPRKTRRIYRLNDEAICSGCCGRGEVAGDQCEDCGGSGLAADSRLRSESLRATAVPELDQSRIFDRLQRKNQPEHLISAAIRATVPTRSGKPRGRPKKRVKLSQLYRNDSLED